MCVRCSMNPFMYKTSDKNPIPNDKMCPCKTESYSKGSIQTHWWLCFHSFLKMTVTKSELTKTKGTDDLFFSICKKQQSKTAWPRKTSKQLMYTHNKFSSINFSLLFCSSDLENISSQISPNVYTGRAENFDICSNLC